MSPNATMHSTIKIWLHTAKHNILVNAALILSRVGLCTIDCKGSDTLESFLSKVAFESDFRKKSCTCAVKTFAIFLLLKETFTIR